MVVSVGVEIQSTGPDKRVPPQERMLPTRSAVVHVWVTAASSAEPVTGSVCTGLISQRQLKMGQLLVDFDDCA